MTINKIPKFSSRVYTFNSPQVEYRINRLSSIDYTVFINEKLIDLHFFTIIYTVHPDASIDYVKESLDSILNQSYPYLECIFVLNGYDEGSEIFRYIYNIFKNRIYSKLILVPNNRHDPFSETIDDPIAELWTAALFVSEGSFVYFFSYDDVLSTNYVECMVNLFLGDDNCTTAYPVIEIIDSNGAKNIDRSQLLASINKRPQYIEAKKVILSFLTDNPLFRAPGGVLAFRSVNVIQSGGFDRNHDRTQWSRHGFIGHSGFSSESTLQWRHHYHQTNRFELRAGRIGVYKDFLSTYQFFDIFNQHAEAFGHDFAEKIYSYYKNRAINESINLFRMILRKEGYITGIKSYYFMLIEIPITVSITSIRYFFVEPFRSLYSSLLKKFKLK